MTARTRHEYVTWITIPNRNSRVCTFVARSKQRWLDRVFRVDLVTVLAQRPDCRRIRVVVYCGELQVALAIEAECKATRMGATGLWMRYCATALFCAKPAGGPKHSS